MRRSIRGILAALIALTVAGAGSPVLAAPTCQDGTGATIRCGTPGAMPVGWTLPASDRWDRDLAHPPGPLIEQPVRLFSLIFAILALFALLPDFDGWGDGDWDRQEGDEEG